MTTIDPWFFGRLACPRDGTAVQPRGTAVACPCCDREYPVVEGVPVMLRDDVRQTMANAWDSIAQARDAARLSAAAPADAGADGVDPWVQQKIGETGGYLYQHLIGKLSEYPIPVLRLPAARGETLLDVGSNWGRWTIAAARLGYTAVGVDPQLGAALAAVRVARQLGIGARYVVADARFLPFLPGTFDLVFSYSVLQHFAKEDVAAALVAFRRVLKPGGRVLVQMANSLGVRCLYHQLRRRFRPARDFEVRYWTVPELRTRFGELVGPARVSVDGFFSVNPQPADARLLPRRFRAVVRGSELLRAASGVIRPLALFADSVYVSAIKSASPSASPSATPSASRPAAGSADATAADSGADGHQPGAAARARK